MNAHQGQFDTGYLELKEEVARCTRLVEGAERVLEGAQRNYDRAQETRKAEIAAGKSGSTAGLQSASSWWSQFLPWDYSGPSSQVFRPIPSASSHPSNPVYSSLHYSNCSQSGSQKLKTRDSEETLREKKLK